MEINHFKTSINKKIDGALKDIVEHFFADVQGFNKYAQKSHKNIENTLTSIVYIIKFTLKNCNLQIQLLCFKRFHIKLHFNGIYVFSLPKFQNDQFLK